MSKGTPDAPGTPGTPEEESPTLDQARRQLRHYGLDADPQAVLVAVRLMSAGARLGQAAETHFARYGLSTGRYRLLADLEDSGGEKSPSRLAAGLGVSRATVTGLVDALERDGLVVRRPSTEDGRGAVVVLTARGAQRLRDLAPDHFDRLQAMVGELTREERAVFLDLLARITRGIGALTEP
ncbi:MarR family transcriptional regulator [Kitasatospora sp. NPDC048540]|uniref:MarR family winged helix-turn-helix transcriptional regulator n=1 Tax=unclassified Kitasatospora TaxID=2633591 RepID=UPI00068E44FB|nr:MarR family transcriptional regulator [Kitasatospora sp. MBT63]